MVNQNPGSLIFHQSNKNELSHWKMYLKVDSVEDLVEFNVHNNSDGISRSQKSLILEIQKNYPALIYYIESFINKSLNYPPNSSDYIRIGIDIELYFIGIYENSGESENWEMGYEEIKGFSYYSIDIKNGVPSSLEISA